MSDSGAKSEGEQRTARLTMSVPEAGRVYFGLGRDASYQAARRGQLPVLYFGKLRRVSCAACERMLREAGQK